MRLMNLMRQVFFDWLSVLSSFGSCRVRMCEKIRKECLIFLADNHDER